MLFSLSLMIFDSAPETIKKSLTGSGSWKFSILGFLKNGIG